MSGIEVDDDSFLGSFKDHPNWTPFPIRVKRKNIRNNTEDLIFQVNTIDFKDTSRNDIMDIPEEHSHVNYQVVTYLHGNLPDGESICVRFFGYKPYFYFSIPEEGTKRDHLDWMFKLKGRLEREKDKRYYQNVESTKLVYKHPSVGFRNGQPLPFVRFSFHSTYHFRQYQTYLLQMFPPPTWKEVYHNPEIVKMKNKTMVCEGGFIPHEVKFCSVYDIRMCGWVKLSAGNYSPLQPGISSNAMYAFDAQEIVAHQSDDIADSFVDIYDIETLRADGKDCLSDAKNKDDSILSIAHVFQTLKGRHKKNRYVVFIWGDKKVCLPKIMDHYKPEEDELFILRYENEPEMLTEWAKFKSDEGVSADFCVGFNNYGFDDGYVFQRFETLGLHKHLVWGRLDGVKTYIQRRNLESKALAFTESVLTPTPGLVSLDVHQIFKRDVTLQLNEYNLNALSLHFLGEEKADLHYSEIGSHFKGTPAMRGKLASYNMQDVYLTMKLGLIRIVNLVQLSRVSCTPISILLLRGQQIRVMGGYYQLVSKRDYAIYREYWNPILDSPIIEDESLWKTLQGKDSRFFCEDNAQGVEELMKKFKSATFSIRSFDQDAKETTSKPQIFKDIEDNAHDESMFEKKRQNDPVSENKTSKPEHDPMDVIVSEDSNTMIYGQDVNSFGKYHQKYQTNGSPHFDPTNESAKLFYDQARKDGAVREDGSLIGSPGDREGYFGLVENSSIVQYNKEIKKKVKKLSKKEKKRKQIQGGFVMNPHPSFLRNIAVLDFNALYPNVNMSYNLDPGCLVIDERFANCPGVTYLEIRFNEKTKFLFAQVPGIMTEFTETLVTTRKCAQDLMENFKTRRDKTLLDVRREFKIDLPDTAEESAVIRAAKSTYKTIPQDHKLKREDELVAIYQTLLKTEYEIAASVLQGDDPTKWAFPKYEFDIGNVQCSKDNHPLVTLCQKFIETEDDSFMNTRFKARLGGVVENVLRWTTKIHEITTKTFQAGHHHDTFGELLIHLAEEFSFSITTLNALQNERKVLANATFGFSSSGGVNLPPEDDEGNYKLDEFVKPRSMMQCSPVSAATTYIGRKCIILCARWCEQYFPCRIFYIDTDSLFPKMDERVVPPDEEGFKRIFRYAKLMCIGLNKLFQFPGSKMKIEFEKAGKYHIQYGPKQYAMLRYEDLNKKPKVLVKGLPFKKRDRCWFVRDTCSKALEYLIYGNIELCKKHIVQEVESLCNGEIDVKKLILYKKLNKNAYNQDSVPSHALVAQKINERKPGLGPKPGQPVCMLYVDAKNYNADRKDIHPEHTLLGSGYVDDADYVIENKIKIDILWYLENQILKNVEVLMGPMMNDPQTLIADYIAKAKRQKMGCLSVDEQFQKMKESGASFSFPIDDLVSYQIPPSTKKKPERKVSMMFSPITPQIKTEPIVSNNNLKRKPLKSKKNTKKVKVENQSDIMSFFVPRK